MRGRERINKRRIASDMINALESISQALEIEEIYTESELHP